MSVYIRGMEMPKVAGRIDAVIQIYKDGSAIIAISPADDEIGYWKEYPLIPVPDHGRLIDADALLRGERFVMEFELEDCSHVKQEIVFTRSIQRSPTIIPADKEATDAE